jgi:hypothetical protein
VLKEEAEEVCRSQEANKKAVKEAYKDTNTGTCFREEEIQWLGGAS